MMISPSAVHLGISVLVVLLCYFPCVVAAEEEECYRGGALLDYENPCSEESGQPATYGLCSKGLRLRERCTGDCVYCSNNTYQDTFTNCTTCLPCITAADCPKGQEIVKNCSVENNAECGCPSQPCPKCECPVQTEWSTDVPDATPQRQSGELKFLRDCPTGVVSVNETNIVEWEEPQATDDAIVLQSHHPGESFKVGNTTVIYVFELGSKNIHCSFQVVVTKDSGKTSWVSCLVCCIVVIVLAVVFCLSITCWRKYWRKGKLGKDHENTQDHGIEGNGEHGDDRECRNGENDNHDTEKTAMECQEKKQKPGGDNLQGTSGGSNGNAPTSSSEAEGPPTEAVYGHDSVDNGQEDESLISGEKHQSCMAPTKNKNEEHCTPKSAAQNSTEPREIIEVGGMSQEPGVCTITKNVVLEEKPKEPLNLPPEAEPNGSLSGRGVVPHSGRDDRVRKESFDRPKSVSHENWMEINTFQFLSSNLSKEWRGVGRRLGIRDSKLQIIKQDSESIQEAIYNMFIHWKQKRGTEATFAVLLEALENEERKDLADDLRRRKEFHTSAS